MPLQNSIPLKSSDGVILKADTKITQLSSTISRLIEASSSERKDSATERQSPIPVKVASSPLKSTIAWCEGKWDSQNFKNMNYRLFLQVILAAKYLEIEPLFLKCCQTVACMFKFESSCSFVVKSPEQIRQTFGIENDLSDEEKLQIEVETTWICAGHCDHSNCCNCVDCRYGFPLLELPDDIIAAIFKQMNIATRLLGRVNGRLYQIESQNRYDIKDVMICDNFFSCSDFINERQIELKQRDILGILQKLAQNHTVDKLTVKVRDTTTDHLSELIPYIKSIPARILEMDISNYIQQFGSWKLDLNDDSLEEWIRDREFLNLRGASTDLSETGLFCLFNDMASSRISLRRITINAEHQTVKNLVRLIGISFAHDTWTSAREDVKTNFSPNTTTFEVGHNMSIIIEKDGDLLIERHYDD